MKKALSLILALVMCLSFCACSSSESDEVKNDETGKYIGQYQTGDSQFQYGNYQDSFYFVKQLQLVTGGTGTYEWKASTNGKYVTNGAIIEKGTVSWYVSDGYLVVTYSGTNYVNSNDSSYYTLDGNNTVQVTETFELKGHLLIDVASNRQEYEKIG